MPTKIEQNGNVNVFAAVNADVIDRLRLVSDIRIVLNANNPPTVKAGSKFAVCGTVNFTSSDAKPTLNNVYPAATVLTYNQDQAIFENADRTFAWSTTGFPALGNSKTYYLHCSAGEDVDETSRGKGVYGVTETAPAYDSSKVGWYNASGLVLCEFKTTGAGVVYGLKILKPERHGPEYNAIADLTVADYDGIEQVNMTTGASNKTVTLPTLADNIGREITFTKIDTGAGYLIVDGEGSEKINESLTKNAQFQYHSFKIRATSTCWIILYEYLGNPISTTLGSAGTTITLSSLTMAGMDFIVKFKGKQASGDYVDLFINGDTTTTNYYSSNYDSGVVSNTARSFYSLTNAEFNLEMRISVGVIDSKAIALGRVMSHDATTDYAYTNFRWFTKNAVTDITSISFVGVGNFSVNTKLTIQRVY